MTIASSYRILLTGAGFTHNFGAPLAAGMWAEIFNQPRVRANPGVRDKLAGSFDFEGVYNDILASGNDDEKKVIAEAVFAAYDKLDQIVIDYYRYHDYYITTTHTRMKHSSPSSDRKQADGSSSR